MENITLILQGYNKEKEILLTWLSEIKDFNLHSAEARRKEIKDRLSIIDEKVKEIQDAILFPQTTK